MTEFSNVICGGELVIIGADGLCGVELVDRVEGHSLFLAGWISMANHLCRLKFPMEGAGA